MTETSNSVAGELDRAVAEYRDHDNFGILLQDIERIREQGSLEELIAAVEKYRDMPEVVGPAYEYIVEQRPKDARALVMLAGAYWLTGRGPDVVGELASRAIASDPLNRAAWHLWALTEGDQRRRMERWLQVSHRFSDDELARANLADNATSLASSENDPVALAVAIDSYQTLLATAKHPDQREAIEKALETLRSWKV